MAVIVTDLSVLFFM